MTITELRNAADLLEMIGDNPPRGVHHVLVYPDAARALLEINTINRTIVQSRVDLRVADLREGRWLLINNGIGIDWNGDLVDGQHRLLAIVQADVPAEVYLHLGMDPKTREVVDTGRARTFADALQIAGVGRAQTNKASAIRLLYRYEHEQVRSARPYAIPHGVLLAYAERRGLAAIHAACLRADTVYRALPGSNRSALSALSFLTHEREPYEAAAFETKLRTGEGLASGDPELALRGTLGRLRSDRRNNEWHLCVGLKAWNARRAGRKLAIIMFRDDEPVPEVR